MLGKLMQICVSKRFHNKNASSKYSTFVQYGIINRIKIDGTGRNQFADRSVLGPPNALAIDWMSRNIYFTNPDAK